MSTYQHTVDETAGNGAVEGAGHGALQGHELGITNLASPGGLQPYAFLQQRHLRPAFTSSDLGFGAVYVHLRAFDAQGNWVSPAIIHAEWDPTWSWEVITSANEIRQACMGLWTAQAACHGGLTLFRVANPEGQVFTQQLAQGQQVLVGDFMMQGFRVETIRQIAVNWASDPSSVSWTGALPLYHEFNLVGGQAPATALDQLRLEAAGFHTVEFYGAQIRLRVFSAEFP
jgi:hypothetical protein